MNKTLPSFDEFLARVTRAKEQSGVDLSTAEDLSLAVMNLISLEEHFYFTAEKTAKDEYFDRALEIRELRKKLLAELMPKHEGETWCISKHLLSATMRLIEVGNKLYSEGEKARGMEKFQEAYRVYAIFWGLRLGILSAAAVKASAHKAATIEDLVTQLADCCDE